MILTIFHHDAHMYRMIFSEINVGIADERPTVCRNLIDQWKGLHVISLYTDINIEFSKGNSKKLKEKLLICQYYAKIGINYFMRF